MLSRDLEEAAFPMAALSATRGSLRKPKSAADTKWWTDAFIRAAREAYGVKNPRDILWRGVDKYRHLSPREAVEKLAGTGKLTGGRGERVRKSKIVPGRR